MLNEQANSPDPDPSRAPGVGRRDLLRGAAALLGTAIVSPRGSAAQAASGQPNTKESAPASRPTVVASDETAIAETVAGKVRGYLREGIFTFKGIPYGDTTAGSGRFAPPRAPQPWTGVRSSMHYGPVCPQVPRGIGGQDEEFFLFDYEAGNPGEDCLRLNIWTPGIQGADKRPVMVWLHGGGFVAGS
jgi:para-nitrobenzyl esterase